jgi:hypothetical protein
MIGKSADSGKHIVCDAVFSVRENKVRQNFQHFANSYMIGLISQYTVLYTLKEIQTIVAQNSLHVCLRRPECSESACAWAALHCCQNVTISTPLFAHHLHSLVAMMPSASEYCVRFQMFCDVGNLAGIPQQQPTIDTAETVNVMNVDAFICAKVVHSDYPNVLQHNTATSLPAGT